MAGRFLRIVRNYPALSTGLFLGIGLLAYSEVQYRKKDSKPLVWSDNDPLKNLKAAASKAGYNNLDKYLLDRIKKQPDTLEFAANSYKDCVAEHGVESSRCKCQWSEKFLLECKAAQNARI